MTRCRATEAAHRSDQESYEGPLRHLLCVRDVLRCQCVLLMPVEVLTKGGQEHFHVGALTLNITEVPSCLEDLFCQLSRKSHHFFTAGRRDDIDTELVH